MKKYLLFLLISFSACAGNTSIFPPVVLDISEASAVLPNPVSIVADVANSQIVVANSNVDILYDTGSLSVLSVDATDTNAPVLAMLQAISAPNFAGEMYFDGAGSLYVPFRESYPTDENYDIFELYTLAAGSLTDSATATVASDPFGVTSFGASIYVVSDYILGIYDATMTLQAEVDLTTPDTADITDSVSSNVLDVAIDGTNNLAVVSNPNGTAFIVDLATNTVRQAIDGPTSTRGLFIDANSLLYILDGVTKAVWVFDLNQLPAAATTPESVDDSYFLLATISVGDDPNGIAYDAATNRIYVTNSTSNSISVIDTLAMQEIARVSVVEDDISTSFLRDCQQPFGITLGTYNAVSYAFVTCFATHDIAVINTATLNVVQIYPNRVED